MRRKRTAIAHDREDFTVQSLRRRLTDWFRKIFVDESMGAVDRYEDAIEALDQYLWDDAEFRRLNTDVHVAAQYVSVGRRRCWW
jgi:hypothetical protein